ncbi:MAG: HEAT repeat domain-containing protein [Anaerolineales bacterium]|nr:HEAT repeat domain-containing protein [Anaerolineales bacterium]
MPEKKIAFKDVIETLKDDGCVFPKKYLYEFSDIEPAQLRALKEAWPDIRLTQKLSILKSLEELADQDTLLSFEVLGKNLLDDPNSKVRRQALRLLFECEDVKLIPTCIDLMLDDEDAETRAEAATLLGSFVKKGELEEIPTEYLHKIEEALLKVLNLDHEDPTTRRRALESLGYSSRPEVPAQLRSAYNRQDPDWIASALFAMGRSCDNTWQENIIRMIINENNRVRAAAVQAAGELGLKAARSLLLRMMDEEDDDLVYAALIWSLSQIGGEDVRTYLENLFDQADTDEQAAYIEEALDNLAFTEDMDSFDLLAYDADEDEDLDD